MWWIIVVGLIGLFVVFAFRRSPQFAIGLVVPIAYVAPAWLILPLFSGPADSIYGSGIDIKVAVGSACLVLYCFLPGRTFPVRIVPCDVAVVFLIFIHIVSDTLNDGLAWMVLGRAYAEWYLPYIAGRLAIQSREDAERIWKHLAMISVLLGALAILEAVADINVFESCFGERPLEGTPRNAARWNMQRAYGPCMHPIYLGVLELFLLAWTGLATLRALRRRAAWPWAFSMVPSVLGIVATGSRGPIFGAVISGVVLFFFLVRRARVIMACSLGVMLLVGIVNRETIVRQLEKWSGESELRHSNIEVADETLAHSGTRNRINIVEVYKIALKRSGLIGFGTLAVSGFPINVPVGPREAETIKRTRFVDNEFILMTLRFGYLGLAAFAIAGLLAAAQVLRIADKSTDQLPTQLSSCVGATLAGSLLALLTVWMPPDIGFPLLWTFGLSSGLLVAQLEGQLSARIPTTVWAKNKSKR